ncbi:hypothetical protein [Leifsonia poae]|uniref:hypothetical protein n=1 Tax=Leifsonia poae TaxID=110933 RepID=UPI001CC121F2|nr:hypothetical protein [Leifsonia poae]
MTVQRLRRLVGRLGGPAAVTVWMWLVTIPFALTVMSGAQYLAPGEPIWSAGLVAAVAHLAVGALLLAVKGLLALVPARARLVRAALAISAFAAIGAVRPFLIVASARLLDVRAELGDIGTRVALNVVVCVTVFSLVAVAVDLIRDHRGVFRRLRAVQRAAVADADAGRRRIDELRRTGTADLLEAIEQEVEPVMLGGLDAATASRLLRSIANDIVRPLSHELFDANETPAALAGEASPPPRRRDWLASVIGGIRPAPPLLTAILFVLLATPYALGNFGLGVSAVQAVLATLILFGGNRTAAALAARAATSAGRVSVIVVGVWLTGIVLAAESTLLLRTFGLTVYGAWLQALLFPVIALALAFVDSLSARLRSDQKELEESVLTSVTAAARIRSDYDRERSRLAHLLHTAVQADLIATALSLHADAGRDATGAVREAVDRIREQLARAPRNRPDPRAQLGRLIETWASAMPLRAHVEETIWPSLIDPARCDAVIDAVSEGLANAVRHGDGTEVGLALLPTEVGGVQVIVASGGVVAGERRGIGLRDLARSADVRLSQVAGGVELAVSIP